MLYREQILSRAQELSETNAKLDVLPMIPQDQNFDMSFWSTVLQKTEEDQWEFEGAYIPDRISVCPVTCTASVHIAAIYLYWFFITSHVALSNLDTHLSFSNSVLALSTVDGTDLLTVPTC